MKSMIQEKWEGKTPRSKLPTNVFGIPHQRKFPLDNEKHVRSAIKLFGHASADKKKSLANRIRSAAKKYNIDIPDNTQVYKYLHESSLTDIIPTTVKNIIFDLGSVLVDHDTRKALLHNGTIPEEHIDELLMYLNRILFYPEEFEVQFKMDKTGAEEAKRIFNDSIPDHLKPYTDAAFSSFVDGVFNFDYTNRLLDSLKSKGYKLYYLSNWFRFSYEIEKPYFDKLTKKFDGGLFSWETPYIKPQSEFYKELLKKYGLNPSECIFFDDREENLIPAQELGMHAHRFDSKTTPLLLLEMEPLEVKWYEMSNTLLISTPFGPEIISITDIDEWFVRAIDDHAEIESGILCNTLYYAIERATAGTTSDVVDADEFYVYIPSDYFRLDKVRDKDSMVSLIKVGKLYLDENKDWYWQIQYPVEKTPDNYLVSKLSELTALNAINPVISHNRHFLMNYGEPGWKQHMAYVNDYDSDKALVVSESGNLEVVYVGHMYPNAIYEYTGPKGNIDRLVEAYRTHSKVDNLYSILSGRKMLSEDQIDYDSDFTKVNLESLYEHAVSSMATLQDRFIASECGISQNEIHLKSSVRPTFLERYNTCGDVSVCQDLDGYYFYSEMTHRRSESVKSNTMLTEAMLESIF